MQSCITGERDVTGCDMVSSLSLVCVDCEGPIANYQKQKELSLLERQNIQQHRQIN